MIIEIDVLFHWDLSTCAFNIETKSTLLQEFAQLRLTIRAHAFTKMVWEEHKHVTNKLPQPQQRHSGLLCSSMTTQRLIRLRVCACWDPPCTCEGTTACIQQLVQIKSFISVSEIRLGSALAPRPVSLCDSQHHR